MTPYSRPGIDDWKIETDIDRIIIRTCQTFNCPREALKSPSKENKVTIPRYVIVYLSRILIKERVKKYENEFRPPSYKKILETIGYSPITPNIHSNFVHGFKTIENMINTDKKFAAKIAKLIENCKY